MHLLEQPALRNAFFSPEEEAPPVEPARADDFDQIFEIAELRDGPDERARIEVWAQRLPHRFSVARGSEGEVLAFYLFARQDDPHSGLGTVDLYLPGGRLIWQRIPSKGKSCSSARCRQGPMKPIRLAVPLASSI
jgi:hypothetical protein